MISKPVIVDDEGRPVPAEEHAGILAVNFEHIRYPEHNAPPKACPSIALSNGGLLPIYPYQLHLLLKQVRRTDPSAFFNTPQEAFDYVTGKSIPIAVMRLVKEGTQGEVFWSYRITGGPIE